MWVEWKLNSLRVGRLEKVDQKEKREVGDWWCKHGGIWLAQQLAACLNLPSKLMQVRLLLHLVRIA